MRYAIQLPDGRLICDREWRSPADVMRGAHGQGVTAMPGELVRIPERIQRQRTAGWRMPLDAVYVGRPTPWGNPFPVAHGTGELFPRDDSVRMYRELVETGQTSFGAGDDEHHFTRTDRGPLHVPTVADVRRVLAGRDLCCWCPLDVPCHADVLLELAAREQS